MRLFLLVLGLGGALFHSPTISLDSLVLLTPRLLLRPYEAADAPAFFAVLEQSRGRLRASFPDRLLAVPTLARAREQLVAFAHDWRTGRFYVFGIWCRESRHYLGDICLMPQHQRQAEIGYYLAPEAEGKGYAREALEVIVGFGFGQVRAELLLIRCFADNLRGQAVAQAQGFLPAAPAPPASGGLWPRLRQRLRRVRAGGSSGGDILYFVRHAPVG